MEARMSWIQNHYPGEDVSDMELLIEAGKLIKQHPTIRYFLETELLPEETEE
jgi:hypothetical protein